MSSQILLSTNIYFPHNPNQAVLFTSTYLCPGSSDCRPKLSVRLGGGGVGVVTTTPLRTFASAVVPVLSPPTNLTTSSDTASCAAPVVLSIQVIPVYVPYVPVPVSYIGSLIYSHIKLSIL